MSRSIRLAAVLVPLLAATPLVAQQRAADESRWQFGDAKGGFCVWYLADSAVAAEMVPKETALRRAGDGTGLPAALARVVRDEPQFAAWIPASICIGFYGSLRVGEEAVVEAKPDRRLMMTTVAFAATSPRGLMGGSQYLVEVATDQGAVVRAGEGAGVRLERREAKVLKDRNGGDDVLTIALDGAVLIWQGHPTGQPRVESTQEMSFGHAGMRTVNWLLTVKGAPAQVQGMIGALRIEGKGDLAKALRSSPIRSVGAMELGGTSEWLWRREGRR